ncbi:MAG TPA: Smr/MutS family protein, partial [Chloroflexota bacterium]
QQELRGIEERRREILDQARQEADALVADVRREAQRLLRELRSRRGQLHEVEALARESLSLKLPEVAERSTSAPSAPVAVGARLHLPHLGVSGTVLNVDEHGRAEIDVRGMRVRMRLDELADAQPVTDEPREHAVSYREVLDRRSRDAIALQIDLRGQRVAEALEALDRYLHDAFLAGLRRVRIVHGKGTGAVRKAVRDYLAGNPLVQDFETAAPDDGGDGATIVRLAS